MNELIIDRMRVAAGDLWERATTHPSGGKEHNQRLEFLGNGVLNLALADLIYHRCEERENKLSAMCDYLRSDDVLNEVGRKIGLDPFLKFDMSTYHKLADSIVAGGVEAVIGAVYERSGYDAARELIAELLLTDDLLKQAQEYYDPVTKLKEYMDRASWKPKVMAYDTIIGGNHTFYHAIEFSDLGVIGLATSKEKAEARASRLMVERIERTCICENE